MARKWSPDRHQTFTGIAEEIAANSSSAGEPVEWLRPIGAGQYTDEFGVQWHLRGGDLPWKKIQRLIRDPQVRILHAYMDKIGDVPTQRREEFMATIRPYLDGKGVAADDYTDFCAGEFRDGRRRSLLVIEETC